MKIEIITTEQAKKTSQTKRFGIISEGCTGIWGEGDTMDEAIENAMGAFSSDEDMDTMDDCWAQELTT